MHLSPEPSNVNGEIWDEFHLQSDDVDRHLQLLRSRVSSLSSAHAQFLDEPEVVPNGSKNTTRKQELCCNVFGGTLSWLNCARVDPIIFC